MCGIVGYVGTRQALPIVLDGLRRLEYRGYDSAGVALLGHHGPKGSAAPGAAEDAAVCVDVRRSVGKLDQLEQLVAPELAGGRLSGTLAVGHTRWATHGPPSERNAHPHTDCTRQTVVVHNGIVENYRELQAALSAGGHQFHSDTDTEVLAHLIEDELAAGQALPEAVRRALLRVRGANAVAVISTRAPDLLVAARTGHAGGLVVGAGEGEMYIASDIPAILEQTRRVAHLASGEYAVVRRDGAAVHRLADGSPVPKSFESVPYDPLAAAKGGYKHFMLKEIYEQPRSLLDTVAERVLGAPPWTRLEGVRLDFAAAQRLRRVMLVACGTAWHAGLVGKFLVEGLAGLPAMVEYASEFRYREALPGLDNPRTAAETLVIAISQSGETADTLISMESALARGAPVLGIHNVVGSQAARRAAESVGVLYTRAGLEIGVAASKTFTCQIAALALLALHLGWARGHLDEIQAAALVAGLQSLPEAAAAVLGLDDGGANGAAASPASDAPWLRRVELPPGFAHSYEALASRYHRAQNFLYLGRGIQYPIALEGALKLKEISYIHAEGYPAGEMKHGPIALLDRDLPVVAIALRDRVYEKMVGNIQEVKAREAPVIALCSSGDHHLAGVVDHALFLPPLADSCPWLAPALAAIPLQLLAYHIAVRRGCDVDQPRNLAKSVTVE